MSGMVQSMFGSNSETKARSSSPDSKHSSESVETSVAAVAVSQASEEGSKAKKRKTNVRACDACAIRKVKCEVNRPCCHCVSNNVPCTQLRERKKSGPKNLHKKTLNTIQSFSETLKDVNGNSERPSLSAEHSSGSVPLSKEILGDTRGNELPRLSAKSCMDNLSLISEEPIIFELLKPLTVQSMLMNHLKLIDFLSTSFKDINNDDILEHAVLNDSNFLSKLMVIMSICILIIENRIKLNKLNFNRYTKKNTSSEMVSVSALTDVKNSLHLKILEIFTLIDKNSVLSVMGGANYHQTFYNLSLSSLHLYNYYRILNIPSNANLRSESNVREDQKFMHLRKALTFYQLVNIPQMNDLNVIQLYELYENLYTAERFSLMLAPQLTISNHCAFLLTSNWINSKINISNKFNRNFLHDIFKTLNDFEIYQFDIISHLNQHNITNEFPYTFASPNEPSPSAYLKIKAEILKIFSGESCIETIKILVIFKLLLLNERNVSSDVFHKELNFVMENLIKYVVNDSELMKIQASNFDLLPHFLQVLKVYLEVCDLDEDNEYQLVTYSSNILKFYPLFPAANKIIKSNRLLNNWFLTLTEKKQRYQEEKMKDSDFLNFESLKVDVKASSKLDNDSLLADLMVDLDSSSVMAPDEKPITSLSVARNGSESMITGMLPPSANSGTHANVVAPVSTPEPVPPVVTPTVATIHRESSTNLSSMSMSESTKNLYNLFNSINDDLITGTGDSFTNLFQFSSASNMNQEEVKVSNFSF